MDHHLAGVRVGHQLCVAVPALDGHQVAARELAGEQRAQVPGRGNIRLAARGGRAGLAGMVAHEDRRARDVRVRLQVDAIGDVIGKLRFDARVARLNTCLGQRGRAGEERKANKGKSGKPNGERQFHVGVPNCSTGVLRYLSPSSISMMTLRRSLMQETWCSCGCGSAVAADVQAPARHVFGQRSPTCVGDFVAPEPSSSI